MKLFIGLSRLARSYPRTTLALIAGLTLLFIGGLTQLRIANDPQEFLPTAPVVQSFRQVERDFGSASFTHKLFVRFAPRPGYSVKSPQAVLEQERVLEALRAVPGIVSATGLPDWVKELRRQMHGDDSAYAQLVPYDKQLGYSLAELIKLTFQRLAFAKQYVSDQGTAMVVAQISPQADLAQVAQAAQAALLPLQRQERATKSGLMSYGSALGIFNRTTRRDLRLFAPLTIGLVVLLLLWLFRYLRPADWRTLLPGAAGLALIAIGPALPWGGLPNWAPWLAGSTLILISLLWSLRRLLNLYLVLIVVGLAGVWKLGLLGLLGLPLNFLLVSTIPLIIGVGIDYPIHLLHRYEEERRGMTGPAAMGKTLEHSTRMLLANTLTTVAGFSSLLLTQSLPIQTFGLLFSFAMIANFLLTLTLLPAIKQLQSEGRSRQAARPAGPVARTAGRYVRLVSNSWRVGSAALLIIPLLGLVLLWEGLPLNLHASDLRRMLPAGYPIVRLYNQIDQEFRPYDQTELLVRGPIGRLALMRAELIEIPMRLAGSPYTRQVRGIAQLIDDLRNASPQMEKGFMQRFLSSGPDSAYQWALTYLSQNPQLAGRAAAYLKRDRSGAFNETVVRIDTARYTAEADLRRVTADISGRLAPVIAKLERAGYQVWLTGTPFVELASLSAVRQSFLTSRIFALVLSLLLVAWVLRSWLWGLLVAGLMLPTTGVELATIHALGIEINAFTAVVGAVSIGLGVTYAIPLIERFRERGSLRESLTTTGEAISVAYLSTMTAFLALLLGGILWNTDFGILAGVAISAAYLVTLLAFPALVGMLPQLLLWLRGRKIPGLSSWLAKYATGALLPSTTKGVTDEENARHQPAGAAAGLGGLLPQERERR